jgi:hypothetical protein
MVTGRAARSSLSTPAERERLSGEAIRYPYGPALAGAWCVSGQGAYLGPDVYHAGADR